ncbi:hypothetical protein [Amycolatopsis sp. NPDC004378]
MAADQPIVPDYLSKPGALQRLRIFVIASQIVLNHLDCVENGLADLPPGWPETDAAEAEGHHDVAAPANPHARDTVRLLARVPRNWTPLLVEDIDQFGREMLDKAFFPNGIRAGKVRNDADIAPDVAEWGRGSRQVIAMMCPPRRWRDAHTALDKRHEGSGEFTRQEMEASRARIDSFSLQHPVAAIHAAAAQVAWLSLQPKVVPDWTARRTEIAVKMDEMKHKIEKHQSRS